MPDNFAIAARDEKNRRGGYDRFDGIAGISWPWSRRAFGSLTARRKRSRNSAAVSASASTRACLAASMRSRISFCSSLPRCGASSPATRAPAAAPAARPPRNIAKPLSTFIAATSLPSADQPSQEPAHHCQAGAERGPQGSGGGKTKGDPGIPFDRAIQDQYPRLLELGMLRSQDTNPALVETGFVGRDTSGAARLQHGPLADQRLRSSALELQAACLGVVNGRFLDVHPLGLAPPPLPLAHDAGLPFARLRLHLARFGGIDRHFAGRLLVDGLMDARSGVACR